MKNIGVVVAMSVESEPMEKLFGRPVNEYSYGVMSIKEYSYLDKRIYFATCTEGEIMASACTQYLISACGAELIFNYGLAGGLTDQKLGNTLLVKGVAHYEFDISPLNGAPAGKYDRFDGTVIATDEKMRVKVKALHPEIEEVICASGDKFVAEKAFKDRLVNDYGASVCEMESAGVLFTSLNAGVPQVILKVISDNGDDAQNFVDFVREKNFEYVALIAEILKNI